MIIRITTDFPVAIVESRRPWNNIFYIAERKTNFYVYIQLKKNPSKSRLKGSYILTQNWVCYWQILTKKFLKDILQIQGKWAQKEFWNKRLIISSYMSKYKYMSKCKEIFMVNNTLVMYYRVINTSGMYYGVIKTKLQCMMKIANKLGGSDYK